VWLGLTTTNIPSLIWSKQGVVVATTISNVNTPFLSSVTVHEIVSVNDMPAVLKLVVSAGKSLGIIDATTSV